jgi:hypothetical protein
MKDAAYQQMEHRIEEKTLRLSIGEGDDHLQATCVTASPKDAQLSSKRQKDKRVTRERERSEFCHKKEKGRGMKNICNALKMQPMKVSKTSAESLGSLQILIALRALLLLRSNSNRHCSAISLQAFEPAPTLE